MGNLHIRTTDRQQRLIDSLPYGMRQSLMSALIDLLVEMAEAPDGGIDLVHLVATGARKLKVPYEL